MGYLIFKTVRVPQGSHKKIHVVVGKQFSKSAVARNTMKRKIRAVLAQFPEARATIHAIVVRPGAETLSFRALKEEVANHVLRREIR